MKRYLKIGIVFLMVLSLFGCQSKDTINMTTSNNFEKQDINVIYFDVGQGNSALIEQNNEYAMIDAGETGNTKNVIDYLKGNGIKELKYMIGTHGDSDHIGGMSQIMDTVKVSNLIIPDMKDFTINTKTYLNLLKKSKDKSINIVYSTVGKSISLGDANLKFYGPIDNYDNSNDWSICTKLAYDNSSFMFTGDAGKNPEKDMVKKWNKELKSDVYLAGHHGSNTSNSNEFLKFVNPQIIVISCGIDNKYGHPHKEAIDRFASKTKSIYRTDESGNIFVGYSRANKEYIVSTKNESNTSLKETNEENVNTPSNTDKKYIGNKNSKVFHAENCNSLPNENNRIYFQNREDATKQEYKPCGRCQP